MVMEVEAVQTKGGGRWQEVRTKLQQEGKGACHSAWFRGMEVGTLLGTHVCLLCGDQLFQVSP